jgi:hypothetical protein
MRTLVIGFIGVTLALALAPPTWAQAPATNAPPSAAAPSPPMAGKTTSGPARHSYRAHSHRGSEADMLNAQELARLQGSTAPAPIAPGGNNPTSGTAGPFYPR